MREADKRGENLGFTTEELAFYDALEVSDSAVKILGDDTLKTIARELVDTVQQKHFHRLDAEGKRQSQTPLHGKTHPPQIQLPTRQTGKSHPNRPGTSRTTLPRHRRLV